MLALLFAVRLFAADTPAVEPLFQAIQKSDAASVKHLLERGLDANARDADGTPALMAAVLYADARCVKLLLDRRADPNATDKTGATALMWAVPDVAKVKLLLAAGADVNATSKNLGRTPLLIAASFPGSVAVLQLLLDHGANIHAKDRRGTHALGRAALSADVDVVRFLVEHGCDPNEPGYGTNVRYARQYPPTLEYLLSKGANVEKDALAMAAHWQDPKLIETWIERGADVNARAAPYNRTALMTATASEQAGAATVKLLLEKGADPNAEDIDGERPLDWALYRGDRDKIAALEQFGATRGHGPRQKTYPSPEAGGIADARTSVERAVNLLLPTAPVGYQKRGCISCHSQALVAMAAAEARKKGIAINEEMARTNLKQIETSYKSVADLAMQGDQPGGNIITIGYVMMALGAEQYPFDKIIAQLIHASAALQLADGILDAQRRFPPAHGRHSGDGYRDGRARPDAVCHAGPKAAGGRESPASAALAPGGECAFGGRSRDEAHGSGVDESSPVRRGRGRPPNPRPAGERRRMVPARWNGTGRLRDGNLAVRAAHGRHRPRERSIYQGRSIPSAESISGRLLAGENPVVSHANLF